MSIYRRRSRSEKYRKIYEEHHGPIPKEEDGRTYEIHHIDGDESNNSPDNLVALTLQDHYDLHFSQGDYNACRLMAIQRMNKTPEEISELGRLHQLQRVERGIHTFQRRKDGTSFTSDRVNDPSYVNAFSVRPDGTSVTSDRTQMGLNPWARRPDGTSLASDAVKNGTCNLLRRPDGTSVSQEINEKRLKDGTHNWTMKWTCEHCGKSGSGDGNYKRWHGDNCKLLR
jgi:hypothetical protein